MKFVREKNEVERPLIHTVLVDYRTAPVCRRGGEARLASQDRCDPNEARAATQTERGDPATETVRPDLTKGQRRNKGFIS
jgi:hypothetical protein